VQTSVVYVQKLQCLPWEKYHFMLRKQWWPVNNNAAGTEQQNYRAGPQSFHQSRSQLAILGASREPWSKFHTENTEIWGTTVENLVVPVTWSQAFVYPWTIASIADGKSGLWLKNLFWAAPIIRRYLKHWAPTSSSSCSTVAGIRSDAICSAPVVKWVLSACKELHTNVLYGQWSALSLQTC